MANIDEYELYAKLRDLHLSISEVYNDLIEKNSKTVLADKPLMQASMQTDFDIAKINWAPSHAGKNGEATWYADGTTNKDNADWKKLWTAMNEARKAKGNPSPFYFWTKMPEGRGFLWFDQGGNGLYRRLHKKA